MHEYTVHLDSTFLGVHLGSTSLGVHLDSMCLGVHLDSTFLGVHLRVHLDSMAVQEQQRSTGHGPPGKTASCGPLGGQERGGTGTAAVDWEWESQEQ